ncbi:hypothetical protein V7S43_015970 [Phytophthora oleae]|uniref:Histone H2A/H2B/H3 domain-containing protein n=1 Tax=Phytophthora oleae TaxID=2107226 RepID=A0ABD3EY19_9STRA
MAKPKRYLLTKPTVAPRSTKTKKIKPTRTKLKAPDSEAEDAARSRSTVTKDRIEQAYYRKVLSEILLQDLVLAASGLLSRDRAQHVGSYSSLCEGQTP